MSATGTLVLIGCGYVAIGIAIAWLLTRGNR
jgi:uncharacterized protein YjeT (DUF2065 family)